MRSGDAEARKESQKWRITILYPCAAVTWRTRRRRRATTTLDNVVVVVVIVVIVVIVVLVIVVIALLVIVVANAARGRATRLEAHATRK